MLKKLQFRSTQLEKYAEELTSQNTNKSDSTNFKRTRIILGYLKKIINKDDNKLILSKAVVHLEVTVGKMRSQIRITKQ